MTKPLALAFLTKDRVELTRKSIAGLTGVAPATTASTDMDFWWCDGSTTEAGQNLWKEYAANFPSGCFHFRANVTGGADRAIVYALTTLLNEIDSPYIGICESDVLLHPDWLGPTLSLFARGDAEGLCVGAASARCYDDRILAQRDGYALMHNLGSGHIILTRQAARIILDHYRNPWSMENRRTFCQLSGLDIGRYWAFAGSAQFLTVDWGFDAVLARHGLASLALVPSCCEMIGQDLPLEQQGLRLADKPVELLCLDAAFEKFTKNTRAIRDGEMSLGDQRFCHVGDSWIIFAHQMDAINGLYTGNWRTVWSQGFGPFCYEAMDRESTRSVYDYPQTSEIMSNDSTAELYVPVSGPCSFIVSGGKTGGKVELTDTHSGYQVSPDLPPEGDARQTMQLAVPGAITYRTIRLRMLTPGTRFYGIRVQEPQPYDPAWTFDHGVLPKP